MTHTRFQLDTTLNILSRTPQTLRLMLTGLSDEWIHTNEGENTWSAFDVVGHLVHGEKTDWLIRIQTILNFGETKTFEPFNRTAQLRANQGKNLETLLDEFETIRLENIQAIKTLITTDNDLDRTGKHPELGTVTLRQLLATWNVHDFNHIAQIARVMGKYYQEEVGPWKAYLGILQPKK